ncbi:phage portal protein [Nitrospirillum viridazoti]|uniref:Phage portal protein n=1 Tax=Nitrospirillum viridazoti CBAmc TaxID=1441467 RepID=A0A248JRM8_9PROT|nr:phage portal protein [Nitrospirillum amazonense]ASG21403.1 phage portal protein [Nitrospirillum amazonense CBAmc]TWB33081.1 lambda family phage portal protein [Nitrospirillum amazonense]
MAAATREGLGGWVRRRVGGWAQRVGRALASASDDPFVSPAGRPVNAPYRTTGNGPRSRNWRTGGYGPNAALDYSLPGLVRQSRELMRQNPDAVVVQSRLVSNVVGVGIIPELADPVVRAVWVAWTAVCMVDGTMSLYGAQALAVAAVVEAGEALVRFRVIDDGLSPVPLRLQVLEAEYLVTSKNEETAGGGYIRHGIEFDAEGRRVAYWLYPCHPDDVTPGGYNNTPIRVPAGEILHIYRARRPGQIRGVPWITPILDLLKDLADYKDAELVRKKVAALYAVFVKRPYPEGMDAEQLARVLAAVKTDDDGAEGELEPGTMWFLDPGEEVEFSEPADLGGQYAEFMKQQYRSIAAAVGLLYEQVTGDYANGNDRLYRAAFNEFRRNIRQIQHHMVIFQMCRPILARFSLLAKLKSVIPDEFDAAAVPWVPEAWPYINPVQDVAAKVAAIRAGIDTRSRVAGESGHSAADIDEENARDQNRATGLGLVYDTNAKQVDDKGAKQPVDPPQEEAA